MNGATLGLGTAKVWKAFVLPAAAAGLPMAAAVGGALATQSPAEGVVGGVEGLSSAATRSLDSVGGLLPFGIAFVAGMVATVNPCGFPMLPAYLAMYLGSDEAARVQPSAVSRLARAVLVASVVTAGFILLFGITGIIIGGGARVVVDALPWVGLGVGGLLAIAGAWLLGGGKLYVGAAQRAADKIGDPTQVSIKGYFLFGLAYATASLSCTLLPFMLVTGISLGSGSSITAVGQFLVYALGMGSVILVLTLSLAIFKGALVTGLRKMMPYVQPVSAGFMILAGAYIVFYWLTAGGLLGRGV